MAIENERQQKLIELVELRDRVAELERELGIEEGGAAPEQGDRHAENAPRETVIAAERVTSMANLARGIAHEINNPLATCMGYLKCAIMQADNLDGATSLAETLSRLNRGAERIRGIVNELQMLSEEMVGEYEKLDLATVVERVCRLVPPELRSQLDLQLEPVRVWVDRPRLFQITYNMIMPYLLAARNGPDSNTILVRSCPANGGDAILEVVTDAIPSPGTRTDLLSALRGEYTPTTLPLRLARRLAIAVGAEWQEGPVDGSKYRSAVLFDAV
jgi:C4-dicarboxylate-specific signal transduction histidine kinase